MRLTLTVFFALHVLSASLALGLPFLIAWFDRRRPETAHALAPVALVNMSGTVVLGVGAILFISVVFARPFTTAFVSTYLPVLAVLPLLSIAFAALYAYKLARWRHGALVCGAAVLAIACVFAALTARWIPSAFWALRLAHLVPVAFVAGGVAMMVRFAGSDEARLGARIALVASLAQVASGVVKLIGLSHRPGGAPLWLALGGAGGFVLLLALFSCRPRVSRFEAVATSVALFFVTLSMATLRDSLR
jgi:hypothetical protein